MRVWDIHPGYLSNQSLLGQHAEIHAIYSVISQAKPGYSFHPETVRWKERLADLATRHDLTAKEMFLRKYNHASPIAYHNETGSSSIQTYVDSPTKQIQILREKYARKSQSGRIPLPRNGSQFWAHHKYSVMARGYQYYKEIQRELKNAKDQPINEEDQLIANILSLMEKTPSPGGIRNVVDHLWGYFKREATDAEKNNFFLLALKGPAWQTAYIFQLAETYQQQYLLHSTVFADI